MGVESKTRAGLAEAPGEQVKGPEITRGVRLPTNASVPVTCSSILRVRPHLSRRVRAANCWKHVRQLTFLASGCALCCGRCGALSLGCLFALSVLRDVDTAFEISAIFDDDTGGFDVPHNRSAGTQRNAALRFDIPLDGAKNDNFLGLDVRVHFAVRPHG